MVTWPNEVAEESEVGHGGMVSIIGDSEKHHWTVEDPSLCRGVLEITEF